MGILYQKYLSCETKVPRPARPLWRRQFRILRDLASLFVSSVLSLLYIASRYGNEWIIDPPPKYSSPIDWAKQNRSIYQADYSTRTKELTSTRKKHLATPRKSCDTLGATHTILCPRPIYRSCIISQKPHPENHRFYWGVLSSGENVGCFCRRKILDVSFLSI